MKKIIKPVDFKCTDITDGFWRVKQDMAKSSTMRAVYDRFKDTGRIDAFKCNWREGEPNRPHIFWDSDVAKWIEGVAYITAKEKNAELEALADAIIDDIIENQGDDGYFNIYFTVVEPDGRFKNRDRHELYCAGHLIEAAVAYYEATGKRKLLDAMCKYADYIELRFKIMCDTEFVTPGHEEIELALVRLYECTGERRYLDLSSFFIDMRGNNSKDTALNDWALVGYNQSHLPVREQKTAEGHAVRATYLYAGMAHLAAHTGDESLVSACDAIFDNIAERRMYVTGGIGSSSCGEAFTVDYDLPSLLAYSESCAAIGLMYFANRMLSHKADSKYSDVIERVLYNGFLSSTSLDGKSFFYENPLEVMPYLDTKDVTATKGKIRYPRHTRLEVFGCSCCPPNVARFIPSVANLLYGDDGETLYVHQFMNAVTKIQRPGGEIIIRQTTDYPASGKVKITLERGRTRIAVRIPGWYKNYSGDTVDGYAYFELSEGGSLEFDFEMRPRLVEADPRSLFNAGKCAVMYGPTVYCTESHDNGAGLRNIRIDASCDIKVGLADTYGVPTLTAKAHRRPAPAEDAPLYTDGISELEVFYAKLIPYFAFANRGAAEMLVWHNIKL